jgi:hypothetical protein
MDGVMFIQLLVDPEMGEAAGNVKVKLVDAPAVTEPGVAVTAPTPGDGEPIEYVLDTTSAYAGSAVAANPAPRAPVVSARIPAPSLAAFQARLGSLADGL